VQVDFNVPYDADIGQVVSVLEKAMQAAKQDAEIAKDLLEDPSVQGWNSFSPWAVQVRMSAKARPEKRFVVASVLRRYGLRALNDAGLQIAVPLSDGIAG
ncbi:MAG: mechanosensitive ion channel family protein, partial [Anaerolineales bacterium]